MGWILQEAEESQRCAQTHQGSPVISENHYIPTAEHC